MKRIIRNTLTTVSALLVLVVAPAFAQPEVPFRASYDGDLQALNIPPSSASYGGGGVGTLLGAGRMDGSITRNIRPSLCPGSGFAAVHTDVLTAANGDTVTLTVTVEFCPTGPSNQYHGVGTYIVTSGTGRFAGATGSGTFDGLLTFNLDGSGAGVFQATYSGTLTPRG